MNLLNKLFKRKAKTKIPEPPSWDTVVEMMYDKELDCFIHDVVKVIYSNDKSKRYVILRKENGLLTYQLEEIYQYDEAEWAYICLHNNALPATWVPSAYNATKSVFENTNDLLNELKSEAEYKSYFG